MLEGMRDHKTPQMVSSTGWTDTRFESICLDELCNPAVTRIKREPRRVWVNYSKEGVPENVYRQRATAQDCQTPDWCSEAAVEFVEVLK